jgi:predicted amidohydrolase YtcJ
MQVHLYADSLIEEYGEDGGRFYPYRSFERHGLPVVVSSDAPVTMPGPLRAAWAAVTRMTSSGATAAAAEQVSREAALRGITTAPAELLDRTDLGTLRPGARADLVLVDLDPVTADLDQLARAAVLETWVAGEPVWTRGGAA